MTEDPKIELYRKLADEYKLDVRTVKRRISEGVPLDAPLKKENERKAQIMVAVTFEEREKIKQLAEKNGLSQNAYIRGMLGLD